MPNPPGRAVVDVTGAGLERSSWEPRVAAAALRSLDDLVGDLDGRDQLVVLSAHPDDETIGAGRLLSAWWRTRGSAYAVLATAGEACVDHVGERPAGLADRRLAEWRQALGTLGVEPGPVLGLPDAGLADREDELADALTRTLAARPARPDRAVLLAPHPADPHPDHQALARAARTVAARLAVPLWQYPVWLTYWADPSVDLDGELVRVGFEPVDDQARTTALLRFTSQTEPLAAGWGPVVPAGMLEHHVDQLLVLPAWRSW